MSWWHPVCGSGAISRYFMVMPQRNTFMLLFRKRAYRSPSLAARNCSAMIQANVGPTYQVIKSEYIMSLFADVVVLNDYGEGEERPYQTSRNRFFCKAPCISVNVTWKNSPLLSWSGNSPPPFAHWKVSLWLPKGFTWLAVDWLNLIPILLRNLNGFVIPCSYWRQPFDKRLYSTQKQKDENQQEEQIGKWLHPTVKSADLQNCSRSVE